jgi:hypothetical protein
LGKIQDPRAVEALVGALGDERGGVRRVAAIALGGIGDPRAVEPLAREIDREMKDLFAAPTWDPTPDRKRAMHRGTLYSLVPVSSLTAEIVAWAMDASGYGVEWGGGFDGDKQHVDLQASDAAIRCLCDLDSPVTSNLLHLVAQKKDVTVTLALCAYSQEERLSFQAQRDRAAAGLRRRGDPPYAPEAYVTGPPEKR